VQKAKEQMNIFKQVQGETPYANNHNMTLIQMLFFCFFHQACSLLPSPYQQQFFFGAKIFAEI
jgi:hypothetical protein